MATGLVARGVGLVRSGRQVLDGIDLALSAGRFTAICGPNGAGKTTLLSLLAGSLRASIGEVRLDGLPLEQVGREPLARRRAMLTQGATLPFGFLVSEVVALGRIPHEGRVSSPRHDAIVAQALEAAGVRALAPRNFLTLSGGERQRVQIARCLAQVWEAPADGAARWLLLDEPTSALDLRWQMLALGAVHAAVKASEGIALIALHDINLALRFCDRIVVLGEGTVLADGHSEVVDAELLHRAYRVKARCEATASGERVVLVDGCA